MGATLKGHSGTVRVLKYNPFSESQVYLSSAGAGDFKPRLWDVNTGKSGMFSYATFYLLVFMQCLLNFR